MTKTQELSPELQQPGDQLCQQAERSIDEIKQSREPNRFFDPRMPQQPEQIFGFDTEQVLAVGRLAVLSQVLPYKTVHVLNRLPDAVRLMPLVERMQSGEQLTSEDVRPYRKPIKHLHGGLRLVDRALFCASALGVGIPARRALNRKIEREFPVRAAAVIETARESLETAYQAVKPDIELITSFKNPRAQFEAEVGHIAQDTKHAIYQEQWVRIASGKPPELPTPKGLFGLVTRAMRGIRSFFGFLNGKPKVNPEVMAYDAGGGIHKTFAELQQNDTDTQAKLPLVSGLLLRRLPKRPLPSPYSVSLAAPEILGSVLSIDHQHRDENNDLIDSVNRNPHEWRFAARHVNNYRGHHIPAMKLAAVEALPTIRNILPTDSSKIAETVDKVRNFLEPARGLVKDKPEEAPRATLRQRFFGRPKRFSKASFL